MHTCECAAGQRFPAGVIHFLGAIGASIDHLKVRKRRPKTQIKTRNSALLEVLEDITELHIQRCMYCCCPVCSMSLEETAHRRRSQCLEDMVKTVECDIPVAVQGTRQRTHSYLCQRGVRSHRRCVRKERHTHSTFPAGRHRLRSLECTPVKSASLTPVTHQMGGGDSSN